MESQAMLTKTLRPLDMLMEVGGEPLEDEERVQETVLRAVDLTQKPGVGERETRVVAAMRAGGCWESVE